MKTTVDLFEYALNAFELVKGDCPYGRTCKECINGTLCNTITTACIMILRGDY